MEDKDSKSQLPKRRYAQHYRKKWEEIPQLRGWLSMFPSKDKDKTTKAFCKYCQRKLTTHVTGLLKHSTSRPHIKAFKQYMDRVKSGIMRAEEKTKSKLLAIESAKPPEDQSEPCENGSEVIIKTQDMFGEDIDQNDEELEEFSESEPANQVNEVKIRVIMDDSLLSTHVLDTSIGEPVVGLGVSLYRLVDGRWTLLSDSVTDADGRCTDLLRNNTVVLVAGRFKLHYDVSQYYAIRGKECFFPFIEVVFDVSHPTVKHHIPMLISPFSYTTYRGS